MPTVKKTTVKKVASKSAVKKVVAKAVPKKAAVVRVQAAVKVTGLNAPVYDAKGAKSGTFALPKEIFGAKINDALMAQAVRVYLANQRLGTAHTQTRGEVEGSTKKIYRQKGTGNARHGGKRAPIFVKGGVAHGPRVRDYSLNLPKKMRKAALFSALSQKAKDGEIKIITGLLKMEPKTKNMNQLIKKLSENPKKQKKVLLITSETPKKLDGVYRAGRNLQSVEILNANLLNTYEVLKYKNLLFMKESIEVLGGSK